MGAKHVKYKNYYLKTSFKFNFLKTVFITVLKTKTKILLPVKRLRTCLVAGIKYKIFFETKKYWVLHLNILFPIFPIQNKILKKEMFLKLSHLSLSQKNSHTLNLKLIIKKNYMSFIHLSLSTHTHTQKKKKIYILLFIKNLKKLKSRNGILIIFFFNILKIILKSRSKKLMM